jgi:hypothetical protein
MSDATTVLFGLPGVRVERVERRTDGTRVVDVVTDELTAAACPACGVVSTSVKERVCTSPKDIPYGRDRIVVRWKKIRWRCQEDYCQRRSFTEAIPEVPARARTTCRLRTQIGAAIGEAAFLTRVTDATNPKLDNMLIDTDALPTALDDLSAGKVPRDDYLWALARTYSSRRHNLGRPCLDELPTMMIGVLQ